MGSLAAYRALFLDDPAGLDLSSLRERTAAIAKAKMSSIYVDLVEGRVTTPDTITGDEADELIAEVAEAWSHAAAYVDQFDLHVVDALIELTPLMTAPFVDFIESREPVQLVGDIRQLLLRLPEWSTEDLMRALTNGRLEDVMSSTHESA